MGRGMCRQPHSSGLGRGEAQLPTSASLEAQHHGPERKGTVRRDLGQYSISGVLPSPQGNPTCTKAEKSLL